MTLALQFRQRQSLEAYAQRRFALSGMANVGDWFPFCRPMEEIGAPSGDGGVVSFAHYDYLGLGHDPRVRAAAQTAILEIGVGAGASRLVGGERAIHRTLESELATFLGTEDVLTLVSGYGTNVGLVSHLLTKDDLVIADEASHNSIMTGMELSRAHAMTFRHNDLDHLACLLKQHRARHPRLLVAVEGLYSMDGDVPDLPKLLALCRSFDCWLMIDEAHSIGVLGATGRGITEHFGVPASEVDLIVGTLSKAFGTCGGIIAGRRSVIDWLRFTMPSFVYSVGLTPPSAAAAVAALHLLKAEPYRLQALHHNSRLFFDTARAGGFDVGTAIGAGVIPLLFPDRETTIAAARVALDAGYFVPPIGQIAVPKNKPRLRFFLTASHTKAAIEGVLGALNDANLGKLATIDQESVPDTTLRVSALPR